LTVVFGYKWGVTLFALYFFVGNCFAFDYVVLTAVDTDPNKESWIFAHS
jgi:hypothetical protein